MSSRARIFDLYARRESARVVGLGREIMQISAEHAEAAGRSLRLRNMAQEIQPGIGPFLAANLQAIGLLAATLTQEADNQDVRAQAALRETLRLRQSMSLHDRRRHFGETAAASARVEEADEAAARAEAMRPPPRQNR